LCGRKMMSSSAAEAARRMKVLHTYRRIMRVAQKWGDDGERRYIVNEARGLFRRNACIRDAATIEQKLFEAESRLELGLHYNIPYPRPTNVVPGATGKDGTSAAVLPAYMDSYKSHGAKQVPKHILVRSPKMF